MKTDRRRCPVAGCVHTIDAGKLMCRLHWRRVSDKTSRAVNVAWRARKKALRGLVAACQPDAPVVLGAAKRLRVAIGTAREAHDAACASAIAEAARDPGAELAHD